MGLFGTPKCPQCGGKTVATGYSLPYPQYRCNFCVAQSGKEEEIQTLKKN